MKPVDKYTLRISNINQAEGIIESTDKSSFTLTLPNNLKGKGKCFIRVVGGMIQLETNTGGNRIIPNNTRIVALRSNLNFLGYDTNNRGNNASILGNAIVNDDNTLAVELDAPDAGFGFTCLELPNEITIEKLYLNPSLVADDSQQFLPANEYTAASVPCFVELELMFYNDFEC